MTVSKKDKTPDDKPAESGAPHWLDARLRTSKTLIDVTPQMVGKRIALIGAESVRRGIKKSEEKQFSELTAFIDPAGDNVASYLQTDSRTGHGRKLRKESHSRPTKG